MAILRKSHVSNSASRIRDLFVQQCQENGTWDGTVAPSLEALFDAVGTVMDEKVEAGPITLGSLVRLTKAPSRYGGNTPVDVRVDLKYSPGEGWRVSRDDENGGGAWYDGQFCPTPEEAIQNFLALIKNRYQR